MVDCLEKLFVIFVEFPALAADDRADDEGCNAQVEDALFIVMVVAVVVEDAEESAYGQIDDHAAYHIRYFK